MIGTADTKGQLRAERSDRGKGRMYRLSYQGKDKAGNTVACTAPVFVAR